MSSIFVAFLENMNFKYQQQFASSRLKLHSVLKNIEIVA